MYLRRQTVRTNNDSFLKYSMIETKQVWVSFGMTYFTITTLYSLSQVVAVKTNSYDVFIRSYCTNSIWSYRSTLVQSYSPPIPTSIMATSTFSSKNTLNARIVKNRKYKGMSAASAYKWSTDLKYYVPSSTKQIIPFLYLRGRIRAKSNWRILVF